MGKMSTLGHPNRKATQRAVREAIQEVRQAIRPRKKATSKPKRQSGSKLLALAAGAVVIWQGWQTLQQDAQANPEAERDTPRLPAALDARAANESVEQNLTAQNETGADTKPQAIVSGPLPLLQELWARFNADECMTRAYALAFILVLSLVPLLLFALAILGFLIHDPQDAANYTKQLISNLLPGQQAGQAANDFIQQARITESAQTLMNGKIWALLGGVLSLLWAAIGLFVSASDPMNRAWEAQETRSFIKLRLVSLGVFLGAFAFFTLSLVVTSLAHGALSRLGLSDNLPIVGAFLVDLAFFLLAALINGGMFTLIYKFLPNASVTWRAAAFGGLIVGLLLEAFKQLFALYLAHFGNFNKIYGAFGGIFLLVTWISYSCILLLAGAILCKMYHEHEEKGRTRRSSPP